MTQSIRIDPPVHEQATIRLSGRTPNPAPETWVTIPSGLPPGAQSSGVANLGRPELWVWNVSEPSLQPFLPDSRNATGAAMIVAPGGACMGLAIDREGYSVARWLTQRGVAAFVLKYRVAPMPADPQEASLDFERRMEQYATLAREDGATANDHPSSQEQIKLFAAAREDGLEAVRYVRAHASQWGLSAHRVGMMGFSAGAVVTTDVTLQADDPSRPDLIAPIYGMLPDKTPVLSNAPPAFIAAAADDWVAPFSLAIYNAWRASGVAAELHVFENGGHGFGVLQQGRSSDQWAQAFDRWLAAHGFARPAHQTNPV